MLDFQSLYTHILKSVINKKTVADVDVFDDPNLDRSSVLGLDDDSPYPEVRSAVANTDDPSIPVNTLRAWVLGIIWAIILPGINQFFYFRYPAVTVTSVRSSISSQINLLGKAD